MFCMHCGKEINQGSAFCSVCGKPQQAQTNTLATEIVATQPTVISTPQGITALDRPTLLETIQIANSVITPYMEALENQDKLVNLQEWCLVSYKKAKKWLFNPKKIPTLEEYSLDLDFVNEYNAKRKHTYFGKPFVINEKDIVLLQTFIQLMIKHDDFRIPIEEAKAELETAENNLNANIGCVNLIPENYRYPFALDEIYSYLVNHRAESWKEAVNLYEEQLHRWKLEENSEEALLLQAQTAALAGKAASSAGTAALFSGLSFFFK